MLKVTAKIIVTTLRMIKVITRLMLIIVMKTIMMIIAKTTNDKDMSRIMERTGDADSASEIGKNERNGRELATANIRERIGIANIDSNLNTTSNRLNR